MEILIEDKLLTLLLMEGPKTNEKEYFNHLFYEVGRR